MQQRSDLRLQFPLIMAQDIGVLIYLAFSSAELDAGIMRQNNALLEFTWARWVKKCADRFGKYVFLVIFSAWETVTEAGYIT